MSTYSDNLRIELITTGTQAGTWGTTTNTNLGTIIEDSIAGYAAVAVSSANQAFTAVNGAADQARCAIIELTTSTGSTFAVYAPPVTKEYIIWNNSSYTATIYNSTVIGNTTAAGTGVAIPAGDKVTVFSDGTNFYQAGASGTVKSVALSGGTTGLTVSGSPVTTTGTMTLAGTLAVANGGTGQTSYTDGQLLIGNTATGGLSKATLTAGSNISITNGNGTITIASTGASGASIPSGTVMLFVQTNAPTGWTKSTTHNNKALRVVSGSASSGGSVDFTTAFASQTPSGSVSVSGTVGNTTLSTSQMPSHAHGPSVYTYIVEANATGGTSNWTTGGTYNFYLNNTTSSAGGGSSHNHSFTGSGTFSGSAINLAVQYVDVIIATAN